MKRGTTPTLYCKIPGIVFDGTEKHIEVDIQQGSVILRKSGDDISVDGSEILVHHTKKDTMCLGRGQAKVQVVVEEDEGFIWATTQRLIEVSSILIAR